MEASTTCMRGFSNTFVPNTKIKVMDLQYVESEELEQTWKAARRQRLKQQEEKIWDEFVKEQDILRSVCKEDPYQFIDQFPESSLREMMETEIQTMRMTLEQEHKRGAGDSPICETQHTVTFSEIDQDEMFRIFEENENEKEDDLSIQDDDGLNESIDTPNTVRERERMGTDDESKTDERDGKDRAQQPSTSKSNENVANMIESSIYCAKVKDLRIKINMELISIMTSMERLAVSCPDPHRLRASGRRAAEFCARFQRIHLYQLQRHIHDIKRHSSMALPFAKYTQFQSQMVRIVALHQTTLQSLQVFHKSLSAAWWPRQWAELLRALCAALRDAGAACRALPAPHGLAAAADLYQDVSHHMAKSY
ncbi:uncharacterized protein LOC126371979 [Pectinophora gossypiella]|uniref:uncharacterized protein LOC126371979 n=1 Tax=Pectinophora gossypiella TaxID=13191 RepID=UPI00214DF340|nr:uncharacterized protein LOC126371979 [Pectinophora gossypiella]